MKRKDLLNFIEKAIEIEEKMAEHMADNVASALQWYDCKETERKNVKEMLSVIASDSKAHSQALISLKKKIEKGDKQEF